MIARNIFFNIIGGSWSIVLYLLIVPVQIKLLGIDAYGLLAFVSTLQVVFSIFDLGLSTTLAREVAIDDSPTLRQTRELIQTLFMVYALVGALLGVTLLVGAQWIVRDWLEVGTLPAETATRALQLAGVAIMLRWPVSFLSSVLIGRGRFDLLNVLKIGSVTLAVAGGLIVILRTGDLVAFAAWNAFTGGIELVLYLIACYRLVPQLSMLPRISLPALTRVWRFARDMSIIYVVATVLMQSDRLMLSRLEPIDQFGYYTLAYNLLFGLTLVQGFVTTAMLPAFAATYQRGAMEELSRQYFLASQGMAFVYALPIAVLIFFGGEFLRVWTSPEAAASSSQILQVLAPAFLINAVISVASTLAIATGMTGFIVRFNTVALVLYLPALYLAILGWGPMGAASAWLAFNLVYLVGMLPLVERLVFGQLRAGWLAQGILPTVISSVTAFGLARALLQLADWKSDFAILALCVAAGGVYGLVGLRVLDPVLRERLMHIVRSIRPAAS